MIDIGKLYCGGISDADNLRYGQKNIQNKTSNHIVNKNITASQRKPIVVWNVTKQCNLKCIHCYSSSNLNKGQSELTTEEGLKLIDQLADYKVSSLLFSGGEPLLRKDLFTLIEYAAKKSLRTVVSTNGTLFTQQIAKDLKNAGLIYAGISLDGMQHINDRFRGMPGAYEKALNAFELCKEHSLKAGLRMTLTKQNYNDLNSIFDFIDKNQITRACFYHLVYSGRGKDILNSDLTHVESRNALDIILKRTKEFYSSGKRINILTVDNHVDGVYLYRKLKQEDEKLADKAYQLLKWNGGGANSSGVGIACVDFYGNVHADQFWNDYSFGNIKERTFEEIWTDTSDPLMKGLKNKAKYLKGRCKLCKYKEICCGSLRVRADRVYNDPWAPDPQCYLTDQEIGLTEDKEKQLVACGEIYE